MPLKQHYREINRAIFAEFSDGLDVGKFAALSKRPLFHENNVGLTVGSLLLVQKVNLACTGCFL